MGSATNLSHCDTPGCQNDTMNWLAGWLAVMHVSAKV